jgi:hypothetical protein
MRYLLCLAACLTPSIVAAPVPYLKKVRPQPPPVSAAEALGPYHLVWHDTPFRCTLYTNGYYTAHFGGTLWTGSWRIARGRVWVRECLFDSDEQCRYSFPLRRGKGGRVVWDGVRCRPGE